MTRPSIVMGALVLAGLTSAAWLGASHRAAQAAPAPVAAAMPGPGAGDSNMTTPGTATAAVSDGQGSVVLTYPNGIIAVFKPANLESNEPTAPNLIAIYRLHTNGLTDRISIPIPPTKR